MRHRTASPAVLMLALLPSCAAVAVIHTQPGPEAPIPVFAADDARVHTAGFVAETLRINQERDGVRYTLMAFVVGDTLTLGAMVKGSFRGEVHWSIGGRTLAVPFDAAAPAADATVTAADAPVRTLVAHGASFRGTSWMNVEVPVAGWIADGTPLQLKFRPDAGAVLVLPDADHHYRAKLERR